MSWFKFVNQRKFKAEQVGHKITVMPKNSFFVNQEAVKPGKFSKIQEANDEYFVENINEYDSVRSMLYVSVILASVTLLSYIFSSSITNKEFKIINVISLILLVTGIPLLIAFWCFLLNFFNPIKEVILNRLEGTITYPKRFFYRRPITVLFSEVQFFVRLGRPDAGDVPDLSQHKYLYLKHPNYKRKLYLSTIDINNKKNANPHEKLNQIRSFYVWYMDKNRPLPLGTAFDPYRKIDFDRRRSYGFQSPLYPSSYTIREANNHQQKIWKENQKG